MVVVLEQTESRLKSRFDGVPGHHLPTPKHVYILFNKVGLKRICRIFGSRSLRNYRSNIRLDTE